MITLTIEISRRIYPIVVVLVRGFYNGQVLKVRDEVKVLW